ncbi:hypothetical protein C8R43DRAFT_1132234 [Mycena crocata]|nr:hypothetical protein C8R43DRAFT_1132234 [Mycena crocata]
MSNTSYFVFKHGDFHHGERYENLDYSFLTSFIIFYDSCYQFNSPSPAVNNPKNLWDDLPDLDDEYRNVAPSHHCRPKERASLFAKL